MTVHWSERDIHRLHRRLSRNYPFSVYVVEVEGRLWVSDSCWLTPFEGSLAAALLREAGQPSEPGTYVVGQCGIRREPVTEKTTTAVTTYVAAAAEGHPLTLRAYEGKPVFVHVESTGWVSLWDRPDGQVVLLARRVLREAISQWETREDLVLTQVGDDPPLPVRCGETVLMPVRRT